MAALAIKYGEVRPRDFHHQVVEKKKKAMLLRGLMQNHLKQWQLDVILFTGQWRWQHPRDKLTSELGKEQTITRSPCADCAQATGTDIPQQPHAAGTACRE